ncbi:MAG: transposase [Desulfobulbaceae bacterium]|uniref:Transposase n=1 Tax=Candidatus Desulfobia pelagia TaxID=2841692 RepID=A0A8J6NCJ7_9BACT|nr:transposase [Candidatus Desulfobia pelagia]
MKSLPLRCSHCTVLKNDVPNKKCQICVDQAMRESFLCALLANQKNQEAFKCQVFQPSLSLVGDVKKKRGKAIATVCEDKSTYFSEVVDNILYGKCSRNGGCGACGDKSSAGNGKNKFHVAWSVRERAKLFANSGQYLSYLHDAFLTCGTLMSGKAVLLWLAPDHLHFYLELPEKESVGEIIEDLQGLIHDALVDKYPEARSFASPDKLLWETSYFLESIE